MSEIIRCEAVSKVFNDGKLNTKVLHNVSLVVESGRSIAITGASGSGKSTLLHILGSLDLPSSGKVFINTQDIQKISEKKRCIIRNRLLSFVYQFHHLLTEFTALENVAMPLLIRGVPPKKAFLEAQKLLEKTGLGARCQHKPTELSGGERQRAAIARALITQPICILADEPTGNLDSKTEKTVIDLLLALQKNVNASLVVVTHDMALAKRMDKLLTLQDGVLIDGNK